MNINDLIIFWFLSYLGHLAAPACFVVISRLSGARLLAATRFSLRPCTFCEATHPGSVNPFCKFCNPHGPFRQRRKYLGEPRAYSEGIHFRKKT